LAQPSVQDEARSGSPDASTATASGSLDAVNPSPTSEAPEQDPTEQDPTAQDPTAPGPDDRRARRARRRPRISRKVLAAVAIIVLTFATVTGISIGRALTAPGRDPLGIKFVEWARGHGAGGIVNTVERWWYTNHPPPVGGRPRHGIPRVEAPSPPATSHTTATLPKAPPVPERPGDLVPIATPALPGEGVWQPTGKLVGGLPAVYETFLRPDPVHTSLVTGAVWMNPHLLRTVLYNGLQEPGGGGWVHGAHIAPADDAALVAAFNGGFRLGDSRGGYLTEGRTVRPLVAGRGSFVIRRDGTVDVGVWGRDDTMTPDVVSVRQNLDLIVDAGHPVAGLLANDNSRWGATLGGKVFVWRSGVGVDSKGNLIYVAGSGLNITTLADVLTRAGAVRAIELDINSEWVSFYTYTGTSAADVQGHKLNGSIQRPPDRYLKDGTRDFFSLFAR
jgi:hypothetical protein